MGSESSARVKSELTLALDSDPDFNILPLWIAKSRTKGHEILTVFIRLGRVLHVQIIRGNHP